MPWARGLVAPAIGVSSACCSGTPSHPFDCTSTRVLRGGASVLGGGATGAPSSSDHSDIAALYVRVVWSPLSEMPPGLRRATPIVFLFLRTGSFVAALFPQTFSDTRGTLCPTIIRASELR